MIIDLTNRSVLVTGASEGLGAEIAATLVRFGASVFLCARSADRLAARAERLRGEAVRGQTVDWARCDLADRQAVAALASEVLGRFPGLDGVINNAGTIGPMGPLEDNDLDAWGATLATNLIGPMALCAALLPHFKARGRGKIVNLSGGGATQPMPGFSAYAASKAALVRFTETLAEETREFGIDVNAIAPGALDTAMNRRVLAAGPERIGPAYHARLTELMGEGGMPMGVAAELCAWLCSAASDGITGRLIAAQWDPWRDLPRHAGELAGSDIYTLRRILPADRGKTWDCEP
jgi:3-oxoacyl-[acyl-carrier protein] reductase